MTISQKSILDGLQSTLGTAMAALDFSNGRQLR